MTSSGARECDRDEASLRVLSRMAQPPSEPCAGSSAQDHSAADASSSSFPPRTIFMAAVHFKS